MLVSSVSLSKERNLLHVLEDLSQMVRNQPAYRSILACLSVLSIRLSCVLLLCALAQPVVEDDQVFDSVSSEHLLQLQVELWTLFE